jgi:hypothetical protein
MDNTFFFQLAEGKYDVQITLTEALDYERRNSYLINLVAVDGASDPLKRLQAKATIAVDVLDVQVKTIVRVRLEILSMLSSPPINSQRY